jgi:hypothetical protein
MFRRCLSRMGHDLVELKQGVSFLGGWGGGSTQEWANRVPAEKNFSVFG